MNTYELEWSGGKKMRKKIFLKKAVVYEMILLFIGMSIIPIIASGEKWNNAFIEGSISGLDPDDVDWGFALPFYTPNKNFVFNLIFTAFNGDGYITITPIGKPGIRYDFPEDFTYLGSMFIFAGGFFKGFRFDMDLEHEKYILSINGIGLRGVEIEKY
ncbi:MAG TPA: hypothetical protein VMY59_09370 [Candidatus Thermoplasmatota archaeon]|nr:hypothetical protein [Candidatus Thermoplasmatota archaeon]